MFPFCDALAAKAPFVVVAFDQRNHGDRMLDEAKNGGWENPNHVNDMYSMQLGTSRDIRFDSASGNRLPEKNQNSIVRAAATSLTCCHRFWDSSPSLTGWLESAWEVMWSSLAWLRV